MIWLSTKPGCAATSVATSPSTSNCKPRHPGIWALGDCNGKGAFTHTAYNDFEIVAAKVARPRLRRVSEHITAYALYTDPPLGRVGMSLAEAERPMTRVARAVEKGETQGFMRILVDGDSEEILGASLLCTGCDEAVHAIVNLMYAKAPYTVMQRAMHIHPTVSELLPTILAGCGKSRSIGPDLGYNPQRVTRCGGTYDARLGCTKRRAVQLRELRGAGAQGSPAAGDPAIVDAGAGGAVAGVRQAVRRPAGRRSRPRGCCARCCCRRSIRCARSGN